LNPSSRRKRMSQKKWANDDGTYPEMVEINFDSIADRSELSTCYTIGDEEVWLPNTETRNVDEMQGTLEIPEWLAKDRGLI
jgi:hypothetical protein